MTTTQSDKPAISIIVPVFNVEKYLRQALESIINQSFTDWECIVVNDGSTDSSPAICEEFAAKDPRITVIHQENGGLSAARNTGFKAASAPYIAYLDSDDWVEPEYLATLYNLITTHNADVAQIGFFREYNGFSRKKPLVKQLRVMNQKTALRELVMDKSMPSYMWNKLYSRRIINMEFPVGKTFEDLYTVTKWFQDANTIVASPEVLYHYRIRRGSIINSNFGRNRMDYIEACRFRADTLYHLSPESFNASARHAYMTKAAINGAKSIARLEKDKSLRMNIIKEISGDMQRHTLPSAKDLGFKTWFRAYCLRNHPRFFSWLMRAVFTFDFQTRHRLSHLYD